ncbi:hypothetical protein [Roseibium algae]|uniref:PH (Pleckstrin Homology) domain-containing protein n=1 Tax=Roseibium algae TaxID=3123038 RepID=A0ABU8TNL8_9HYPH
MGRSAKLELLRRIVPLFLAVLGIVGATTFMTLLSGALCIAAGIGMYCALPQSKMPNGAVRPVIQPSVLVTDAIGFGVGVPLFSASLLGAGMSTGVAGFWLFFILMLPASLSIVFFMVAVRSETSWVRFFGNGFEVTQLGLTARVRYTDLNAMRIRQVHLARGLGWLSGLFDGNGRKRVSMLGSSEDSKTFVFIANSGTEFLVPSEGIPDLQRVLIGMDRAGVELPEGISERERKKIRRVRERMYRKPEDDETVTGCGTGSGVGKETGTGSDTVPLDVARIAETVRKYREQQV